LEPVGVKQGKFLCKATRALTAAIRAGDSRLVASLREEIRAILEHLAWLRDERDQHLSAERRGLAAACATTTT
jgi:hypothetical protein